MAKHGGLKHGKGGKGGKKGFVVGPGEEGREMKAPKGMHKGK